MFPISFLSRCNKCGTILLNPVRPLVAHLFSMAAVAMMNKLKGTISWLSTRLSSTQEEDPQFGEQLLPVRLLELSRSKLLP